MVIWIVCSLIDCAEWTGELVNNDKQNVYPILTTLLGRSLIVLGLSLYIFYIVTDANKRFIEYLSMGLITVGPILNACACYFYVTNVQGFKFTWMTG